MARRGGAPAGVGFELRLVGRATAGDASLAAATPQRRPWIEQISTAPRAYVGRFPNPEECAHVIAAAEPLVERSGVIDSKTGAPAFDPIRTSYGASSPSGTMR